MVNQTGQKIRESKENVNKNVCLCESCNINSGITEAEESVKLYSDQAQSSRWAPSSFHGRLDVSDMTGREHCVKSEIW